MENNHATQALIDNVEQALIELMADYLDSESLKLDEAIAEVKDPIPRDQSELHKRMAKAAFNEYRNTMSPATGTGNVADECLNNNRPYGHNWEDFLLPDQMEFLYKAMHEYASLPAPLAPVEQPKTMSVWVEVQHETKFKLHKEGAMFVAFLEPKTIYPVAQGEINNDLEVLTEENIMKLRRIERDDFAPFEFRQNDPGERQVEKQYWSNWIHDDYKLHLCPSYKTEWVDDKTPVKSKEIDFWFIWYCEGNRFLPLMDIRQNKLIYVKQLQDLIRCLTGKELSLLTQSNEPKK